MTECMICKQEIENDAESVSFIGKKGRILQKHLRCTDTKKRGKRGK